MAVAALRLGADGLDEHRADAGIAVQRVDRDNLEYARTHLESDEADDAPVPFGDETREHRRVEGAVMHDDFGGTPEPGSQPLDRGPVAVVDWPDQHVPLLHRIIALAAAHQGLHVYQMLS
jgi:hypothetical protein